MIANHFFFCLILFSSIWSDVFPVRWPTVKDAANMCQNWMKLSPSLSSDTLSTCPCTLRQALRDTGRYFVDPLCNLQNDKIDTNCLYNQGAAQCFRRSLHGWVLPFFLFLSIIYQFSIAIRCHLPYHLYQENIASDKLNSSVSWGYRRLPIQNNFGVIINYDRSFISRNTFSNPLKVNISV